MQLRDYQEEAKHSVYKYFKENPNRNPCVVLPTGAGKTPLLASICKDVVEKRNGRVLIVAHVKELLEQAVRTLKRICPELNIGLYSAGLNSKDTKGDVIVAGVQSVYRNAFNLGKFDVVIVDEAHLIPPDGDGMYQQLLKDLRIANPRIRLVGLTATPYRLKSGRLCSEESFLNDICYEADVKDLIVKGYLSKIQTRVVDNKADTSELHIRMGEYVQSEVDALMNKESVIKPACEEILAKFEQYGRKKCLLFASNVKHAKSIKRMIESITGSECGIVLGDTPAKDRAETLAKFKTGELKFLVNVAVLTTGFDDPSVDLVAILRPTASPGLYYQMVGRGLRIAPGKDYCLVLDFGANIERHGPIDEIKIKEKSKRKGQAPVRICPRCGLYCHASLHKCPDCGCEFPFDDTPKIQQSSSGKAVISKDFEDVRYTVDSCSYKVAVSKSGKNTVKICYVSKTGKMIYEWLCPEHEGYPRSKFVEWWHLHSNKPAPQTAQEVVDFWKAGFVADTISIVERKTKGDQYSKIIEYDVDQIPTVPRSSDKCNSCIFFNQISSECECKQVEIKDVEANRAACKYYQNPLALVSGLQF